MPKRALVLIGIQNDYFPGGWWTLSAIDACATRDQELEVAGVPAAEVYAAFMAALQFEYAKLVSTKEYLAAASNA